MLNLSPRGRLIRDAVIFTPLFLLCGIFLLLMIVGVADRAVIGMILLAIVTFLFGYQSIQALRDLGARPAEITGPVVRRWTKRDAFVAKSHYITVEKSIFRIPVDAYMDIIEGDSVRIVAYPHSGTVVEVERLERKQEEQPAEPRAESRPATGRMRTLRTARATPSARRPSAQAEEPGRAAGDELRENG